MEFLGILDFVLGILDFLNLNSMEFLGILNFVLGILKFPRNLI